MAGTQDWMTGLSVYFIGMFVIVSLFSIAGVFREHEVITTADEFSSNLKGEADAEASPAPSLNPFSWKGFFKDIFSFFVWDIQINEEGTLMNYFWLVRIIIVYIPLLVLLLTLWYSVPTVSG